MKIKNKNITIFKIKNPIFKMRIFNYFTETFKFIKIWIFVVHSLVSFLKKLNSIIFIISTDV